MFKEKDCCSIETGRLLKEVGYDEWNEYSWYNNWRVRDEIQEKHPGLSDEGYYNLQKKCGGPYDTEKVYGYYEEILKIGSSNKSKNLPMCICSAPTFYEAQKWLRERGIIAEARYNDLHREWTAVNYNGEYWQYCMNDHYTAKFKDYESALNRVILDAVKYYKRLVLN